LVLQRLLAIGLRIRMPALFIFTVRHANTVGGGVSWWATTEADAVLFAEFVSASWPTTVTVFVFVPNVRA
jgi:hypothetical protein